MFEGSTSCPYFKLSSTLTAGAEGGSTLTASAGGGVKGSSACSSGIY